MDLWNLICRGAIFWGEKQVENQNKEWAESHNNNDFNYPEDRRDNK